MGKEEVLELIRYAPCILGPKNGYQIRYTLEQIVPLIYSNKTLPKSMTPENFQRNIQNMYKNFYGKEDWNMDYRSFCYAMHIPVNIARQWSNCMERHTCIEKMQKGQDYLLHLKIGGFEFSIVGTLQGFLTDTKHRKYHELPTEEKNSLLISIYNRVYGTVLLPVYMLQDYTPIPENEIYEAGMLIFKNFPLMLYEHQKHYGTAAADPALAFTSYETRISIIDYLDRLFEDADISNDFINDTETLKELYKETLPKDVLDNYIEYCQTQYRIIKDILYLNVYGSSQSVHKPGISSEP